MVRERRRAGQGRAVIRRAPLIALVGAFLIGCAVLLMVGGSGMRAEASQEEKHCEKGKLVGTGGPPLLLLAGAALCTALMILRSVIRYA